MADEDLEKSLAKKMLVMKPRKGPKPSVLHGFATSDYGEGTNRPSFAPSPEDLKAVRKVAKKWKGKGDVTLSPAASGGYNLNLPNGKTKLAPSGKNSVV